MPSGVQGCDAASATVVTLRGVREGARDIAPAAVFVVPFGLAFGAAAVQKGLDPWLAVVMSALLCAGASQFAALDMWAEPLPALAILVTVAIVNARHLLYGAALYPWISSLSPGQRFPILLTMTDLAWSYAMAAASSGKRDAGVLLGSGLLIWLVWILATAAGALLGAAIGNPKMYGLDVVMVSIFAANLVGLWRGPREIRPWVAAAIAALAGLWILPAGWHVIAAALAGGTVGVICDDN